MSDHTPPVSTFALVAAGGFAGALSRYAVDLVLLSLSATLLVNGLGSFVLGLLFYGNRQADVLSGPTMLVAATGFVSSFTTYSTFVVDAVLATPATAGVYVLASYALGFGAVLVGRGSSRWLLARTDPDDGGVG